MHAAKHNVALYAQAGRCGRYRDCWRTKAQPSVGSTKKFAHWGTVGEWRAATQWFCRTSPNASGLINSTFKSIS